MRRIRWILISLGVVGVVALVAWGFWSSQPTPSVNRKVIDAYAQKGATYGRLGVTISPAVLDFAPCDPDYVVTPSFVPAFRFKRFDGVRADDLPAVGQPFGLDLSECQVSGRELVEVAKFDDLTRLNLAKTPITDSGLEHLAGLASLTQLSLRSTGVTDAGMKHLSGLSRLAYLDLRDTKVTGRNLQPVATFPDLIWLLLDEGQVTDKLLTALAKCDKLHTLTLIVERQGPGPTHRLTISGLDLSRTQVTGAGLKELATLSSLRSLRLSYTQVTGDGLEHLASLALLQSLDLSNTAVTDDGLKHLAAVPHLQSLDLRGTSVTSEGLKRLASLPKLGHLDLSPDQLTDQIVGQLISSGTLHLLPNAHGAIEPQQPSPKGEIRQQYHPLYRIDGPPRYWAGTDTQIRLLLLCDTKLTDAGLEHLAGLTDLEELDLTGTSVTAEGRKRIQEKLPKCRVRY